MGKLIISRANKKPLTKNQQAFNKITAQIEKLRRDIARKQLQFDSATDMYNAAIPPLRLRKAAELRKVLVIYWEVYISKRLSRQDQRLLKKILQEDMYELLQLLPDKPDEELLKMFRELEGESYEQVLKREDAEMKEEVKEMFGQMNIDIDLDDVEDEAQLAEKLAKARQKVMEQEQQKQHQRQKKKKTARQVEKQNIQQGAEELKQKNISTIYRQLAKLFHPDLEQDEKRKEEKELLMKQLTTAYQARDLHELLLLELKWIHKESNHLESLTEEKLAVYLQVLREQARALEQEKYNLFRQHRYHVLVEEFGMMAINAPLRAVENEKRNLENDIAALENDKATFQSDTSLKAIKQMLKDAKAAMEEPTEEDYLNMLLSMIKE